MALAFAATVFPVVARAQRNQVPGPDTKKVLVTAFRGDAEGGVKAADEIRNRVQGEYSIKVLMPISKKNIDATLTQSGYKPDSALSPNDIKELAKLLVADEVIDGVVTKSGLTYHVVARFFLPRDPNLSQPLVVVDSKDFGDIARMVVDEYDKARKQIPDNQACENGLRASSVPVAVAAARKGITSYPKATLLRLCMAQAYAFQKTTADSTGPWKDSVIAITKSILDLDKTSNIALRLQYEAYKSKGDTADALNTLIALLSADPTNQTLIEQVIAELVLAGKADMAVPIVKQVVAANPGDPGPARTYWQVLRATKNYKESVPAGVAYVALDSTGADSNYFFRQISDLATDSAFAKAAEMAAAGAAKYPKSVTLLTLKAQNERKAGQLPAAKATLERVLALDPKTPGVTPLLAQLTFDQGDQDGAIKLLKGDAANDPAHKEQDAQVLLGFVQKLYAAANTSKTADDFKKVIPVAQASDDLNKSPGAAFYIAVSAFQAMSQQLESLKTSKSCEDFKAANDLLSLVSINMPRGGSLSAATAQQIMTAVPQYQPFFDGSIKRFCK
ncbi:MAG: hypothetical protein ABJE47_03930 [bacterium]